MKAALFPDRQTRSGNYTLDFYSGSDQAVMILIFAGNEIVMEKSWRSRKGRNSIRMNFSTLPKGNYDLRIIGTDQIDSTAFTLA